MADLGQGFNRVNAAAGLDCARAAIASSCRATLFCNYQTVCLERGAADTALPHRCSLGPEGSSQ